MNNAHAAGNKEYAITTDVAVMVVNRHTPPLTFTLPKHTQLQISALRTDVDDKKGTRYREKVHFFAKFPDGTEMRIKGEELRTCHAPCM